MNTAPVNQLRQVYRLRMSDFDRYGRMQPAAVLDLCQDAAAAHAERLGVGFDDLRRRGLAWVVLRMRYEQLAQPQLYDQVAVTTWPHPPGIMDFGRDYCIDAMDGTPLVRGSAQWAVIHTDTRRLLPAKELGFPLEGTREEHVFQARLRKLPPMDGSGETQCVACGSFAELDLNGHVNNSRYANYILNALRPGPEEPITSLQLDYHREVLPDTALTLRVQRQGDGVQCAGYSGEQLMFQCSLHLGDAQKGAQHP